MSLPAVKVEPKPIAAKSPAITSASTSPKASIACSNSSSIVPKKISLVPSPASSTGSTSPGSTGSSSAGSTANTSVASGTNKKITTTVSSKPTTTLSTSKVWVLPPRPKPGRKPSVDAPPNKRKAQNRAAQRAFRERRAALVNELEDKLTEIEKERNNKESKMESTIRNLQKENEELKKVIHNLENRINGFSGQNNNNIHSHSHQDFSMEALDKALEQKLPVPSKNGRCSICIKDACLCEQVGLKEPSGFSTSRSSSNSGIMVVDEPQEIDFTDAFSRPSKRRKPSFDLSPTDSSDASDTLKMSLDSAGGGGCGFCSEGTPCVCAESAASDRQQRRSSGSVSGINSCGQSQNRSRLSSKSSSISSATILPPIRELSLPLGTPHTSSERRSSLNTEAVSISSSSASSPKKREGCSGNPGTCLQCQKDPMSTLFCTTLASRDRAVDANGRAVKRIAPTVPLKPLNAAEPGTFIPCQAAYQTLSRHKDFRNADFGAMVSKLTTKGMEVEVNSVANILLELDKRSLK